MENLAAELVGDERLTSPVIVENISDATYGIQDKLFVALNATFVGRNADFFDQGACQLRHGSVCSDCDFLLCTQIGKKFDNFCQSVFQMSRREFLILRVASLLFLLLFPARGSL